MIKVAQFGEGNFLRTFVDVYFDTLNKEGGEYSVSIIKPITFGSLEKFAQANNKYHVVLRGMESGKAVENVYKIDVLDKVISPFENMDEYYNIATDKDLKIIVSNTTEAGICFNEQDKFDSFDTITYPAKLTKFLYARFKAGLDGVYLMPVELIENNADELYKCVDGYIKLWNLPKEFKEWNDTKNFYCNTLVDRIVSGYPRDPELKAHLFDLIGEPDELVSIGEPFGLWAVEKKGDIAKYVKEGVHNIEVVLTENIGYYKKRKVRVLNGAHTSIVACGLILGKETVYDFMTDKDLHSFFKNTLEEIIPFVSDDIKMTRKFADSVEERFFNPFLNHQLISIALNSISKWKARDLPSFKDYYNANGVIPKYMTIGFSYLMYLYTTKYDTLKDDTKYLEYFKNGGLVEGFMKDESIWGEDLSKYDGFVDAVKGNIEIIKKGEVLL